MKINNHEIKLRPIEPKPIEFDREGRKEIYVNLKGERLTKMQMQKAEYKWINKVTGEEHDYKASPPAKSYKGQPVGTQEKTKEVTEFEECDDVLKLIDGYAKVAKTYQAISNSLKDELKEKGKGYVFQYNPGRNYIPYKAVLYYDEARDVVLMKCLQGNLSEIEWSNEFVEKAINVTEKAKPLTIKV